MKRIEIGIACAVLTICLGLAADAGAEDTPPACKRAEVNPVTGYTFCVDPLGAPVAPAPKADPCKTGAEAPDPSKDADFTWRPTCTDDKSS